MNSTAQFSKQKYLNLETFRKNGESMKIPVWFVQVGKTFFVLTVADSGKVNRIRNNEHVNVEPCKMDDTTTGTGIAANAREISDVNFARKNEKHAG